MVSAKTFLIASEGVISTHDMESTFVCPCKDYLLCFTIMEIVGRHVINSRLNNVFWSSKINFCLAFLFGY